MHRIQITLKISKGQLISRLKFTIILMVLLHGIVSKMNELVIKILHIELLGCSTNVSVLIPVPFLISVDACHADVGADIKLAFLVEEGHDVLLDDVGTSSAHFVHLVTLDYLSDLLDGLDDFNTGASIGVLSRFDKPSISFLGFGGVLELLVLLLLLLLFQTLSSLLEFLLEPEELLITHISNMEGHGNVLEWIDFLRLIVILEIHEERLLVGKVPITG